jgi:hypothetical protein
MSTEIIQSLNFALQFWELGWRVKLFRQDMRELISECSVENIRYIRKIKTI